MRTAFLIACFILLASPAAASAQPEASGTAEAPAAASCRPGERPTSYQQGWPQTSDAICDYDFAEANRRLANLLELPAGAANIEVLKGLLDVPHFNLRDGYEPNEFYVVNAGYLAILAGRDGWDMVIAASADRREGAWGSKTHFGAKFLSTVPSPQLDVRTNPGCLSEAALLDRAIAAGWRYVPGGTQSGTAGPIFVPGALVKDDGRSLVLAKLSRTTALPPRETLEATCAWIFSFNEMVEIRN
ncbi:hypothetical protein FHR22_000396 [Sphingopyxis panaciterrae]|uniref:hypothetical protein n=1 Tax=Sphingopyxis panaciterrae TaxID=363841 RepID=UPI00141E6452|nr:hypothetical protein [Sphingopyxis panaciterrae]NIJ35747.1 hypothetical protein [Sphingopyxis panaciterrae]